MSAAASLELELRSDPCALRDVREHVRRWTADQGWSEAQIAEIVLAVDEALTNVILHGYAGRPDQRIVFSLCALDDADARGGLECRIRDFGQQVEPGAIRGRKLSEIRPGGLGVHIIRAMMSSAEYARADGGGMLLTMRKYKDHTADVSQARAEEP